MGSSGGGGYSGLVQQALAQLPQNMGGTGMYPGMPQNENPMAPQNYNYGQQGNYNTMTQDMQQGQMGKFQMGPQGFGYQGAGMSNRDPRNNGYFQYSSDPNRNPNAYTSPNAQASWPSFGQGGMAGRYNNPQRGGGYGGAYGGGGFGQGGFQNYGRMQQGGAMPYGGGSGMQGGGGGWQGGGGYGGGGMFGGGYGGGAQSPYQIQPAQQVQQFRNYRSPFGGGGGQQYGPQRNQYY